MFKEAMMQYMKGLRNIHPAKTYCIHKKLAMKINTNNDNGNNRKKTKNTNT